MQPLLKSVLNFLEKQFSLQLPHDPAVSLLYIFTKNQRLATGILAHTLFTIARKEKQLIAHQQMNG